MISIICVYNNKKLLEEFLLKSLKNQNSEYELVLLDNTGGKFKSAAEALNYGGKKAKGKYIMFVHQDVDLISKDWLKKCENMLDSIKDLGIAGVAGMSEEGKTNKERGRSIILEGIPKKVWPWGNAIKKPEEVQTLDELLLIVPKNIFKKNKFDEKTCDNWHLYGVDYCLSCKEKNFKVVVLPLKVYHRGTEIYKYKSPFKKLFNLFFLEGYSKTLKSLLKKHKKKFKIIYTTCGDWNTICPLFLQRIFKIIKNKIKYPT